MQGGLINLLVANVMAFVNLDADRAFCAVLLSLTHSVPVALHQLMTMTFRRLHLFEQHLTQETSKTPFNVNHKEPHLFRKVWLDTAVNHTVKVPLALYFILLPGMEACGMTNLNEADAFQLPSAPSVLLYHLAVAVVLEDFLFYWCHRMLHTPWLFKHVHRKHHEFHNLASYPIASEYTHPVESVLGLDHLSLSVGPQLTCLPSINTTFVCPQP